MTDEQYYITCELCGGLGNQLFQVACVYALAFEYGLTPVFKKIASSPSVFKNRPVYFDSVFRKLSILTDEEYNKINFVEIKERTQRYIKLNLEKNKSYTLNGYFQSPKYFKKYSPQLFELFQLTSPEMQSIQDVYDTIKKNNKHTVSVHVRRGDYLQLSHFHNVLVPSYYRNAIKYFDSTETLFVVFSDDIEWCKNNLPINNVYFVENVSSAGIPFDVFELFLMSLCDHNIIANSSFSCWAAYLNQGSKHQVVAPKKWFVPVDKNNEISDIYDENWIIIYAEEATLF